jgi:anti-sigma B factor antagonist
MVHLTEAFRVAFSVVNLGSGVAQIAIGGQLDHATIGVLRTELSRLLRLRPTRVDLDLSRLRLIDTSGVGMLLGFFKNLADQGGHVSLCGLRDQPLEIFKLILMDVISAESDLPN